ncbi:phage tail tube protein [Sphingomonas bacterium]|uniref:phage tail tube protein n=1 Tax=Sphingomonas bacterium TaxID=1895847 RepID=UPI001574F919|nr:phage tail tube protein [Sphingomonas bacterium]
MTALTRLAGTMYATIDGKQYMVTGEGNYTVSSVTRETLKGQSGIHGFSEMPQPGKISWKARDGNDVSIAALNGAVDATVVLELANGKMIIGRNMWKAGDPIAVTTEDASFDIEFEGPDVSEA